METPAMDGTSTEEAARPCIPVHVFTPLLGSMLLSQNSLVADPTRAAIVAIIAKIRGVEHAIIESWKDTRSTGDRRSYVSQTGIHQHVVYPFSENAKKAVEHELLEGLVLGMGRLDAGLADLPSEIDRTQSPEMEGMTAEEAEALRVQLSDEAVFGRAISMNLIASVAEFYPPEDIERLGFIDAVLAAGADEAGVKTEAALALAYLAKVVPMRHIADMVSGLVSVL
jgi:serine/threonine-protein phosphatase 4 regulatory subunit 1